MKNVFVFMNIVIFFIACKSEVTVDVNDPSLGNTQSIYAPVLQSISTQSLQERTSLNIDFENQKTGNDLDSKGNDITYFCTYDFTIDGSVSSPAECSNLGDDASFNMTTGEFSWMPGYLSYETAERFEIKVIAASPYGTSETIFSINLSQSTPFVSTWRTTAPGESITLPLRSGYTYNIEVDWGDGSNSNITAWNDADATHTYTTAGDYTVTITGYAEAWYFNASADKDKILSVSNLGDLGWKSFKNAFLQCSNLTSVSGGNTSNVTNMSNMFNQASNAIPDTSDWDTSKVTDMTRMFYAATNANPDTSNWDISNVTSLQSIFFSASSADPDTSQWNTSKVTNMYQVFAAATSADPDVSNWDTSSVTNMGEMFYYATSASPDVSNWDTSNVQSMAHMFSSLSNLTLDLSGWDVSSVTTMEDMFLSSDNMTIITNNWDVSSVQTMEGMFWGADNTAISGTSNWNLSSLNTMERMFYQSNNITIDTSNWNTSNVSNMQEVFSTSTNISADVSNWNTSSVTNMHSAFRSPDMNPNVSNWDTSNVTNMGQVFYHASNANPDTSAWDLSSTTNVVSMFNGSAISTTNYSNFLNMAAATAVTSSLSLGIVSAEYNAGAVTSRDYLVNTLGWTISDLGQE